MILGLSVETIATIGCLMFLSAIQLYCTAKGKTDTALKIEKVKEKTLRKLKNKQSKEIEKAEKLNNKIKEIEKNA